MADVYTELSNWVDEFKRERDPKKIDLDYYLRDLEWIAKEFDLEDEPEYLVARGLFSREWDGTVETQKEIAAQIRLLNWRLYHEIKRG